MQITFCQGLRSQRHITGDTASKMPIPEDSCQCQSKKIWLSSGRPTWDEFAMCGLVRLIMDQQAWDHRQWFSSCQQQVRLSLGSGGTIRNQLLTWIVGPNQLMERFLVLISLPLKLTDQIGPSLQRLWNALLLNCHASRRLWSTFAPVQQTTLRLAHTYCKGIRIPIQLSLKRPKHSGSNCHS